MKATLNRRTLMAGISTLSAAVAIPSVCSASPAQEEEFGLKLEELRQAREALAKLYATNSVLIGALETERPKFPEALKEVLDLPGGPVWRSPPDDGWSASNLQTIANGTWSVVLREETKLSGYKVFPVKAETRLRAQQLLSIRMYYEQQRGAWWQKVKAIEDTTADPVTTAYALAFAVLSHPVKTLREVQEKIAIVEQMEIFECCSEEEDTARDSIFRDIAAIAMGGHVNA